MLWIPKGDADRVISNSGAVGSATPWTAVPSHATVANSYGTVTELISAANNTQDSWGIEIVITQTGASATASQGSVDILIGGATDDMLIQSLLCGYTYGAACVSYLFPLHIPAGVRLAAQFSSPRTAINCRVGCYLYGGGTPPWRVGRKVITYGTKIDNSRGVAIVPAASGAALTETQITASSTEDHFAFNIGMQPATDTTITPAGAILTQLGVGAATADKVGAGKWFFKTTEEYWDGPYPKWPTFAYVDSGVRLSIWSSNSGANDAAYDAHIYAVS